MKLQDIYKNNSELELDGLAADKELTHQVQVRLIDLGLLTGVADGIYGPYTKQCLTKFLTNAKLPLKLNAAAAKHLIEAKTSKSAFPLCASPKGQATFGGIALIKEFEGCYIDAYPDPLSGGKPITIGWGCTKKLDGSDWELGDRITAEEADQLLEVQLQNDYLPSLEKIPCWQELNANQQGAILSFAYNLGAHFYGDDDFKSITNVLKNKQWDKIESTFVLYCNPGTDCEEGLKRRRIAEAKLFLTPTDKS